MLFCFQEVQKNYNTYSTQHQQTKKEHDTAVKEQEVLRERRVCIFILCILSVQKQNSFPFWVIIEII